MRLDEECLGLTRREFIRGVHAHDSFSHLRGIAFFAFERLAQIAEEEARLDLHFERVSDLSGWEAVGSVFGVTCRLCRHHGAGGDSGYYATKLSDLGFNEAGCALCIECAHTLQRFSNHWRRRDRFGKEELGLLRLARELDQFRKDGQVNRDHSSRMDDYATRAWGAVNLDKESRAEKKQRRTENALNRKLQRVVSNAKKTPGLSSTDKNLIQRAGECRRGEYYRRQPFDIRLLMGGTSTPESTQARLDRLIKRGVLKRHGPNDDWPWIVGRRPRKQTINEGNTK